jgi:hypothetical protein
VQPPLNDRYCLSRSVIREAQQPAEGQLGSMAGQRGSPRE